MKTRTQNELKNIGGTTTTTLTTAVSALAILAFISCQKSSTAPAPAVQPNPQTSVPQTNVIPNATNRPPMVGVVNAVSVTPGQYLAGVLTADDPDRSTGDTISRIELNTNPPVPGLTGMQIPVGSADKHNYSILVTPSPGMPSTIGTFTVYDSRGASTSSSFAITFVGVNTLSPSTSGSNTNTTTALYCSLLAQQAQAAGLTGTLTTVLPPLCNTFLPQLLPKL